MWAAWRWFLFKSQLDPDLLLPFLSPRKKVVLFSGLFTGTYHMLVVRDQKGDCVHLERGTAFIAVDIQMAMQKTAVSVKVGLVVE